MSVRLFIAALILSSAAAFAQAERETPPETPPQQPPLDQVPAEKPAPKLPAVKLDPERDKDIVAEMARQFFTALLVGEAHSLMDLSALPFWFEDKRINSEEEFAQSWQKALRKNASMLTLYGVEVLHSSDMEKKYGKPPTRLSTFPWRKPTTYVAVGNISGRAAVVVFQKMAEGVFAAIGYHD